MISKEKKYKTRSGLPVRIYATNVNGLLDVHGAYCKHATWVIKQWDINGKAYNDGRDSNLDLVEINEKEHTVKVWFYMNEFGLIKSSIGDPNCSNIVAKKTVKFYEGEGL